MIQNLQRERSLDSESMSAMRARMSNMAEEARQLEATIASQSKAIQDKRPSKRITDAHGVPSIRVDRSIRALGGRRWAYMPWFMLLFTGLCVLGCYVWAYENGHIDLSNIPFISKAIDMPPESCFGSLFLAVVGWFLMFLAAIRWRLNSDLLERINVELLSASRRFHVMNSVAVILCVFAAICITGLGSFQLHVVYQVHYAFAVGFFVSLNIYLALLVRVDYRLKKYTSVRMRIFRLVLVCVSGALFIVDFSLFFVSGGLEGSVRSVIEIVMSVVVLVHLMTFASEFSSIEVLFDVRRLSKKEIEHRIKSETTPLIFDLEDDGDV